MGKGVRVSALLQGLSSMQPHSLPALDDTLGGLPSWKTD